MVLIELTYTYDIENLEPMVCYNVDIWKKINMELAFLNKIPSAVIGGLFGLVLGGVGGAIFNSLGFIPALPWKEIFIFFGSFFGFILGYNQAEED